ncbi:MAG: RNA polymerase sigma factor [Gammaproteobacteria bacterium]|nr:RNA polymerase sigma factor [Gammaproteobacteria bacterium]
MSRYKNLDDEALIRRLREADPAESQACRNELFTRVYPRVAQWCLRLCGNRDDAADMAQDVVERVHKQLDSFRLESRFTTWLYTVTRRTALNRMKSEMRHRRRRVDEDRVPEPADTAATAPELLTSNVVGERIRDVMKEKLNPMEAQVVYLHYVDGMTLPAITNMLGLTNKSGSKALLVGGMRKLRRHLGPWLDRQFEA